MPESIVWYGEFGVRTVSRDDRRGEKLGITITYEILHLTTVISQCSTSTRAHQIAQALHESSLRHA
jgi:hypothetical protein